MIVASQNLASYMISICLAFRKY